MSDPNSVTELERHVREASQMHGVRSLEGADAKADLARRLVEHARYSRALELYEEVLQVRVEKLGLEHPNVASTYNK